MDNFFAFFRREAGSQPPADVASETPQSKGASFGDHAVQVNSATGALSVATWYRAMELRMNTMSQLVMELQKKMADTHGGNYQQYNDSILDGARLNYLLQVQPNPTMTWTTLIKQAEFQRVHQGNAVIFIERDVLSDNIKNFWLCSSASLNTANNTYTITYNTTTGPTSKVGVDSLDVLHIKNTFSNDWGLTGVSTLRYARETLSVAATNDKLVKDSAAKGMRQKLLLQEDKQNGFGLGRANKKELEKVQKQLQEDVYDKDVILLNNIANVTPISTNLQQAEINLIRAFSVNEVCRFLGTPLIMVMHPQNETYKTPEAATQEFLLRTIQPLAHDWEMELNAKILGSKLYPQFRFKFRDESLMRLDPIQRANIGKTMIETGVKCVNELRADYDLPKVEGGDRHFISTNLQAVDAPVVSQNNAQGGGEGDGK